MTTTLYGVNGRTLIAEDAHSIGFYICGECPLCQAPVLFHGGGETISPSKEPMTLPNTLLPTCICDWEELTTEQMQETLSIPSSYNLFHERYTIETMHMLYMDLLSQLADALRNKGPKIVDFVMRKDESDA